jgi:antitoxin VapB
MAFSIKNPEADRLARQLAEATGETLTEAVIHALRERLQRQSQVSDRRQVGDELAMLAEQFAQMPVLDDRPADEILGYGPDGLPS